MTDFAMPAALELEGTRRTGIPALRREVVHNTTTQNEYRPGELCYIPLDTGAAGAFTDVSTTRLEMTVVVRNKNYFIDFINLPRCGWHSLIQEFGIEINNGIHELNRHYAECVELEMIKLGQNKHPFEFTKSNPWKPAHGRAGKFHINFIKPSMVTSQGLPHNVQYPALSTLTSATTPDTITQALLLFSNPFLNESMGIKNPDVLENSLNPSWGRNLETKTLEWFVPSSFDIAQAYYDDRLPSFQDSVGRHTLAGVGFTDEVTVKKYANNSPYYPDDSGFNTNNINGPTRLAGLPHGGHVLAKYSKCNPANVSGNIYTVSIGESVRSYPPSMWPAKQPCDLDELNKSFDQTYQNTNADSIMNYYANCKNIPVGIPLMLNYDGSDISGKNEIWGNSIHSAPTLEVPSVGAETEFHIVLKLYSSLIGELAKKWFPELVVPQGRMRVRLRFQEPQIVFQTLMDPCRRVPGTSRDWFPNLGVTKTVMVAANDGVDMSESINSLSLLPPSAITSGVHPIMVSNYIEGDVYIDAIALGEYPLPIFRMKMLHDIFTSYDVTNEYKISSNDLGTKLGGGVGYSLKFGMENYASAQALGVKEGQTNSYWIMQTTDAISGRQAGLALSNYHFEMKKNQEFGFPIFKTNPLTSSSFPLSGSHVGSYNLDVENKPTIIGEYYNYRHPNNWSLRYVMGKIPAPTEALTSDEQTATYVNNSGAYDRRRKEVTAFSVYDGVEDLNPTMKSDPYYEQEYKDMNWSNKCFPTPQYLPMINPSNKKTDRKLLTSDFVDENQCCFGTYRESSVAQVRRTHTQLYPLQIPDSVQSRLDERLTYIIRNVQIVTQQIVLPRTAALSVVENALNGGISMETRAWKEMESMLPRQETQKALINMAAAFCTDISFVFRPIDTFQGDRAFGYNSFSFYNPFTSFHFEFTPSLTPDSSSERDYNYLGGRPIYYNECIAQQRTGFDIQLQLSSELLPRQPIDSIRRLIQHIRWGDQVFSDRDYMQLNPHLHPSYGSQKGMVINTLQDGFWACYVPISALDDQTITCNPFFTPTEITLRKRIRGKRAPINALPIYKPFDGTFHLSFNLEAFMGQNERIRTGVPIVNNNMFLKMDKCHLLRDYDTQLLTIASCDARVVFERGGTMQFFT